MELVTIRDLISSANVQGDVLDVGVGGLDGKNTSNHLYDILYMNGCKMYGNHWPGGGPSAKWCAEHDITEIVADFYEHDFGMKFDMVVQDMPLLNNVNDWNDPDHLNIKINGMLKDRGCYLTYLMLDRLYGQRKHQIAIAENLRELWKDDFSPENIVDVCHKRYDGFYVKSVATDSWRNGIQWVLFEKL